MKIKINFFQKIFIFSIILIIITMLLNYIFNIFFLENFYIQRKSKQIIKTATEVKKRIVDEDNDLDDYFQNIKDKEGINIDIIENNRHQHFSRNSRMGMKNNMQTSERIFHAVTDKIPQKEVKKIKAVHNNISIIEMNRTGTKFIFYKEVIPDNKLLILTTSLTAVKNYRQEISFFNILTAIAALLISIVICTVFSKKITKDIEKLNLAAKKISILDFSEKISILRNDEIGELSSSINIMSQNLEASIENLKSFTSNASHELKTPIPVIHSHAQALASGIVKEENLVKYYKNILKESIEMNDLVTNLLTISKLSVPGIKLTENKISALDLIKKSILKYETLDLEKDISWSLPENDFIILGEKKLLKTAFDNIIQNSLKYSKENSIIKIFIDKDFLKIENTMNSTFLKNKELLWEPFSRGENATDLNIDGNGLGLSIVKMILKLNHLIPEIEIENNKFILLITINPSMSSFIIYIFLFVVHFFRYHPK